MKVLKIEPGKKPEIKEIENSLESLQSEVLGDIEAYYPFVDNAAIICNEEGKINGMELNREIRDENAEIMDIIAGPFLVVGLTEDDFGSLDDELIEKYSEQFKYPQRFYRMGGKIQCIAIVDSEQPQMKM